jgi:hypothetical protein
MNVSCIESFYPQKNAKRTLLFGSWPRKNGRHFDYWNQPLIMGMRICYLDCHDARLCCLRPLQLFHFHLRLIYWLSLIQRSWTSPQKICHRSESQKPDKNVQLTHRPRYTKTTALAASCWNYVPGVKVHTLPRRNKSRCERYYHNYKRERRENYQIARYRWWHYGGSLRTTEWSLNDTIPCSLKHYHYRGRNWGHTGQHVTLTDELFNIKQPLYAAVFPSTQTFSSSRFWTWNSCFEKWRDLFAVNDKGKAILVTGSGGPSEAEATRAHKMRPL